MVNTMKRNIPMTYLLLLGFLVGSPVFAAEEPFGPSLDRIVVTINDNVVTQSELDKSIIQATQQLTANNTSIPSEKVLRKQVLDQLINRKVQLLLAEQVGIHVTDTEVDKTIGTIASGNNMSAAQLYQKVAAQGLTQADYRNEIRDELALQHIQQQEVGARITVSPQEVDEFMHSKEWLASNGKEYHLDDILIPLPETPAPQDIIKAKKRAENLVEKIHQGMNFKAAAAAESGGSDALNGGDLGWRKLPEIPAVFASQVAHMKLNEIMGPIQAANGFHIIQLTGIRNGSGGGEQLKKNQIEQLVYQRKLEDALQSWITKIRGEAIIHMQTDNT